MPAQAQSPRLIGVVTVGRSDYDIWRPVLAALAARDDVRYGMIVGGAHLVTGHGDGLARIRRDGHPVLDTVDMLLAGDTNVATALSMGVGLSGFARSFARCRPDMLLLLGDRFESFAAGAAAVPLGIPLLHVHGGEVTEGAMDERFRHALTKLSHLHCAATALSAARIRRMGEEAWRVHVTGAPGLDVALENAPMERSAFFDALGVPDPGPYLLVTYHPVTNEPDPEGHGITALLRALAQSGLPAFITTANADPGGAEINRKLLQEASLHPARIRVFESLGPLYPAAMRHAAAMVGNSSSGIIEACSHGLPVVNIGNRQRGRERSGNLLDCATEEKAIAAAIRHATSPDFRHAVSRAINVYGDGRAGPRIAAVVATAELNHRLMAKRFDDGAETS